MIAPALQQVTRLPQPIGYDGTFWKILCEVVFPHINNAASITLAVEYCRARKLDILKRPVNIVPMWNAALRSEVDTIWPSITETQITAARSHEWAGMDKPEFGPMLEKQFTGKRKNRDGGWSDAQVKLRFPEWVAITVYRLVAGQARGFTEPVYWLEAYGRSGGSELPNAIWQKRPIGQLIKVAKAASLRAAFPEEESSPTDEEMHGGIIDEDAAPPPEQKPARAEITEVPSLDDLPTVPTKLEKTDDQTWTTWGQRFIACVRSASDLDVVVQWETLNKAVLDAMLTDAPRLHSGLLHSVNKHKLTLMADEGNQ